MPKTNLGLGNKRLLVVGFAAVIALVGVIAMTLTSAAVFTETKEAEDGTPDALGIATVESDAAASGGKSVRFGTTPPGSLLKPAATYTKHANLRYSDASQRLLLDLYTPDHDGPAPLVVWVHGGGWTAGSKDEHCYPEVFQIMKLGFAGACINYRYSTEAPHPAQIEDVKSAIRWLRANAATYKLFDKKIGVWGGSAGGHLAALAGTSGGVSSFDKGENLDQSSSVNAVVDLFGPTDLVKMAQTPGFTHYQDPNSILSLLVGGPIMQKQQEAMSANPITYITESDPPFIIHHGDKDNIVPPNQSQLLHDALKAAGISSDYVVLPGAGHGGAPFNTPDMIDSITMFFDQQLR